MLNTKNFYAPLLRFLDDMIEERFLNAEHRAMWDVVDTPGQVLPKIASTPRWREDARSIAAVRA